MINSVVSIKKYDSQRNSVKHCTMLRFLQFPSKLKIKTLTYKKKIKLLLGGA